MKFNDGDILTIGRFSPHMEPTKEGYLLCRDVPISKVGQFEYSGFEAGLPAKNGRVLMSRTADELFSDDTIKSFNLKPVVISHARFADPQNWKDISVGIVNNVRRGEGQFADSLLADLLITDKKAIDLVKSGRIREVSCGYDANPISDGDGYGHQVGIVGNHVALVDKARCGGCKIRDGQMTTNLKTMLRRLFRDGDEDKFNEALDNVAVKEITDQDSGEPTSTPTQDPTDKPTPTPEDRLAILEKELSDLKTSIAELVKQKTADQDPPLEPKPEPVDIVSDDEANQVMADSETLCPGIKRPTGDAKNGKFSREVIQRTMRAALKGAGVTMFGDAATLDGDVLKTAFKAAVEMKRQANNPKAKPFGDSDTDGQHKRKSVQELNDEFWKK